MPNRLANEHSLYLRQHADNPVDWYPWGEEAFATARGSDKPILVSIGYSSCHWCHVMAHESFEDAATARLMNEHFICIKVDREERPDVDQIYMEAVQMLNGHGGWPLNVFCLPGGEPFTGGTYFPPEDRGQGIAPWPQVLMRIAHFYEREKGKLLENAEAIAKNLTASSGPDTEGGNLLTAAHLIPAAESVCEQYDNTYGGFGGAPKFPPSMTLEFLLEMRRSAAVEERNPSFASTIDDVVESTLTAMARGGIFDQIGGGFARYSVDREWTIPHFEKMLYDNALLLGIYSNAWLRYRNPLFQAVVEETIDWLTREMLSPDGGFYSSLDADSEGEEGKFHVWTPGAVQAVLGKEDGASFCEAYAITESGNFEGGSSNPTFLHGDWETRCALRPLRRRLLAAREDRIPPGKDTKRLTAWNSLLIRGLADAGFAFQRKDWLAMAKNTADWIWATLRYDDNRLYTVSYDDGPRLNGYLDDYAFYAEALLAVAARVDWLAPGTSQNYLSRTEAIVNAITTHFSDTDKPGYFFTSNDHETLVSRKKEWLDNALPSGNSSLMHVFSSLHAITGKAEYGHAFDDLRLSYPAFAERAPNAISHALAGYVADAVGIAVIKIKGVSDLDGVFRAASDLPARKSFFLTTEDDAQPHGFQLCVGTQCLTPTDSYTDLMEKY
jgi:hypothetical protein